MAICSKCGAQLFETSKFCPECGTPVLEVSTDTNKTGDIYSASENADDENSMAVFQGIDPSEISPDETAEILEAAAEKALEDIPEIVKIEGVDIHTEKARGDSFGAARSSGSTRSAQDPGSTKSRDFRGGST
ncbi:MAG: zinc ribbon domain-containing protein [Ruminococcus sp.]|nr:MAG: zinc ribbon domain-containing protein [Ruminococcus sp.]